MSKRRNKSGGKRNRTQYDKVLRKKIQQFPHPEEKAIMEKLPVSNDERDMDEEIRQMEEKIYGPIANKPFIGFPIKFPESRWPTE